MKILSDAYLMRLLSDGYQWPMSVLLKRYGNMVYRLVSRLLQDSDEVDDIAQEVFIKVWMKAADYDEKYKLSTWIYHIAYNLSVDCLRELDRKAVFESEYGVFSDGSLNFADPTVKDDFRKLLKIVLSKLTPSQRGVFCLSELEGLSYKEISYITGMTYDSIKSNLYLARKNIRNTLQRRYK